VVPPRAMSAIGALSFLLGAAPAAPASAAGPAARCTFDYHPRLHPGLSLTPGSGTVDSDMSTGVANCTGSVGGHSITGSGTFGFSGTYGDDRPASCQDGGTGKGSVAMTLPTDRGGISLRDPISFKFGPGSGYPPGVGDWTGTRTAGSYLVLPSQGDCVTSPVTEARGRGSFTIVD
jgi:hypothetical protein